MVQIPRLDTDYQKSASFYPDIYSYRMVQEGNEILQLALCRAGCPTELLTYGAHEDHYQINHPLVVWASNSLANWLDAFAQVHYTHVEYLYRYGGENHASYDKVRALPNKCFDYLPKDDYELQPCVMDDKFKIYDEPETLTEVVENYRNYMREEKSKNPNIVWSKVDKPEWLKSKFI